MPFEEGFLTNQFPKLPADIVVDIYGYLPGKDVLKSFLYLKSSNSRKEVIGRYFQGRMDFCLSPHDYYWDSYPSRVYWWLKQSSNWNFIISAEIQSFLDLNQDINPPRLKLLDETSTSILSNPFFKRYITRFSSKVDQLILEMDEVNEDLEVMVNKVENVYGVIFGSFNKCLSQMENGVLLEWKKLSLFRTGEPKLKDWSNIKFPSSLKTFQLCGCYEVDFSTLKIPDSVEHIVISDLEVSRPTDGDLDHPVLENFPLEIIPSGLKTLSIQRFWLERFTYIISVKNLPQTLKNLDLYQVEVELGPENYNFDSTRLWPPLLEKIKLTKCSINDSKLMQLNSMSWPEKLRVLDLSGNGFSSLSFLNYMPQNLDQLNLSGYKFLDFDIFRETTETIKFPKYLTKLNMGRCKIKCLNVIELPPFLKTLSLYYNEIKDLRAYEAENITWSKLVYLESLDLSHNPILSLRSWYPPDNLAFLDLSRTSLTILRPDCSIFAENRNKKYSKLKSITLRGSLMYINYLVCVPPNLSKLDLSFNYMLNLVPLHSKFFTPNLRELCLCKTKIEHLEHHDSNFNDRIISGLKYSKRRIQRFDNKKT
ncbi:L domain-like protein [Hyphopichia burtonii NRRL Y-1933]|uniref:L domain-like protein n=1 Tax=Hyphopichia burtonii NRRL Y-1933 TaxID=984485 RepID=A0A1E4RI51_9ASCO|nr:L domain-like protein [Hyphopichia burtonii NRRL Y-1933]ODV66775.1 L domain-like protein [Hyphopichia burtonii NRRL Y-1933]